MASYVPSAASSTHLMPSVISTRTRGSRNPSAICTNTELHLSSEAEVQAAGNALSPSV